MTDNDPILPSKMVNGVHVPRMRKSKRDDLDFHIDKAVRATLSKFGVKELEEPVVAVLRVCAEVDPVGRIAPAKAYLTDEEADRWIADAPDGDRTFFYIDLHGSFFRDQVGIPVWNRVREVVNIRDTSDYRHGDVGWALVDYMRGMLSEVELMEKLDGIERKLLDDED